MMDSILKRIRKAVKKDVVTTYEQTQPQNLNKEHPKAQSVAIKSKKKYGNAGRLEIPSLKISVPLYDTSAGKAQQIVDNKNSAALLNWGKQKAIADHSDQANFKNLNKAIPGRTKAYIVTREYIRAYVCYKTQIGHIKIRADGNRIYDENWELVYGKNAGGLTLYTCIKKSAVDIMDVRLTYWKPIAEKI